MIRPPPISPLFPYTTLSRSEPAGGRADVDGDAARNLDPAGRDRPFELDASRSEEHTSELQSPCNLVCRLLLEKKKTRKKELAKLFKMINTPYHDTAAACQPL